MAGAKGTPHGWYLSTAVSVPVFNKVNRELLKPILEGSLKEIVDDTISVDSNTCRTAKLSISAPVILIPFSIILGPVLLTILGLVIQSFFLGRDESQQMGPNADEEMVPPNSL